MCSMGFIVNIDVDDLEKATRFYQAAFGLRVSRRLGETAVEMLGGSTPIYLLAKPAGTPASSGTGERESRRYERHWTPVHLDFIVEQIESAVQGATLAGAWLEAPISSFSWGRLATMADPFGHGFCFVQFLGRGYDEIAD